METQDENIIVPSQDKNQIEAFDGEILHPSLDIKDNILTLGFRYCSKSREEKNIFVVVSDGNVLTIDSNSFERKEKTYYFETRNRKLMRIEEK